jgi:periplasmic divalent cation tolerance protein
MPRSASALQVVIAVPDAAVARRIALQLLAQHLCACVQTIGPVTSRYRWRGKIDTAREYLLLVKTRAALFGAVERVVRRLHPYEVPEIAAQPLAPVHAAYLAWLRDETRATPTPRGARRRARAPRAATARH